MLLKFVRMEILQQHYHIIQRQRAATSPAAGETEIILQVTEDGVRILQFIPDNQLLSGLDEIRFTRRLGPEEKMEQFRLFIPESLLSEASFSRIHLAADPPAFSLIPELLFSEESAGSLLELAGNFNPEDGIFHEKIGPDMVLVFSSGRWWNDWARGIFQDSEISRTCNFSGLLTYASGGLPEEDALLAHIGPSTMHAFGRKNGNLCFFNRFAFRNEQDLLYYFLLSMEQSGLDPENSPVYLCGSIMSGSAGFEKISRYAGNLRFAIPPEVNSALPPSSGIRHPQYFDLLSLIKS